MLIKIRHISDSTMFGLQHVTKPQTLVQNPSSNLFFFNLNQKQQLSSLSSYTRLERQDKNRRIYVVYSGVEPGIPPSGPPANILNWVVAVAIAVVIPLINYKWGPTLKNKLEMVMQKTEDVAEAVEKVAEKVEKVAEDIVDDLPEGGKLRETAEFVEKMAERTRLDAGAVDDFIDKVQGEEEKADESLNDESKIKNEDPKQNN